MSILIKDQYVLLHKLGNGSFASVYMGFDKHNSRTIAIKLIPKKNGQMLHHESSVYREVSDGKHCIPRVYWYGEQDDYNVLIIEYMGNTIESLFTQCGRKFSLKTTLMIGVQIFDLIEYLHRCNFIHRDLKPENFVMGDGLKSHLVYMIDFGLSKRYKNAENQHMKLNTGKKLVGTARYASINNHKGLESSRRDDLESFAYLLIYFLKGQLPWQSVGGKNRDENYEIIKQRKINTTVENLCAGIPVEFCFFLDHVRSLRFEERPNYKYLKNLLVELMTKHGFLMDYKYDWVSFK